MDDRKVVRSLCHISVRAPTTSRTQLYRSTILSALGPDHALTAPTTSRTRLYRSTILSALGPDHALTTRTSQWVTHSGIALARTRLTSEFRWNLKSMSSQKASC
ncbi:unnamed protein product [Malus baccata var. baccata]